MAVTKAVEQRRSARALYITYDGLTDPLGQSQVLPYLAGLAERGHHITVLSCEKPERMAAQGDQIVALCAAAGIAWHPLELSQAAARSCRPRSMPRRCSGRPSRSIARSSSISPIAAATSRPGRDWRSSAASASNCCSTCAASGPTRRSRETTGTSPIRCSGAVYRYFKRLESRLLRGADHIISLTDAGKAQL